MAFSLAKVFSGVKSKTESAPTNTVGIDFGSASVKVVEIEQTEKALLLKTYGELQLGPYDNKALGEVVKLENKKRMEALVDVIREARVTAKHGALAMPLAASFMTVIPITAAPDEDISARIPVEARKFVPLPLPEVTLDWTELNMDNGAETKLREVMLAAIENRALNDYKALLTAIGMTGEPAEIEAFSLIRSLWKSGDTTLAIMDFGAQISKLYIVRNGVLERLHRVAHGGNQITRRISELLSIPFAEAEDIKRSYERTHPQARDIYKSMVSVVENPLLEFKHIIGQYEARLGSQIGRVALSGGVSASPYFVPYVQDALGRPVQSGNPFSKVAYPAFMEDTLNSISPIFATSLGAALRQFQYN